MLMRPSAPDFLLARRRTSRVSFDGFKAVNDLNLYVDKDELRVIIGPNGAGKTTVLDLICGKTKATAGSIKFKDQELTQLQGAPDRAARHRPQVPDPVDLRKPDRVRESRDFVSRAAATCSARCFSSATDEVARARRGSRRDDLPEGPARHRAPRLLSHGQKQWLEIGMLLMQDPELLMLDEPVAGMSVRERAKTAELLKRIIKNRSVIVIEHDMKFVEEHRPQGHGAAPGQDPGRGHDGDRCKNDPKVIEVYLGH